MPAVRASIGRIVHLLYADDSCQAAIITGTVSDTIAHLTVFSTSDAPVVKGNVEQGTTMGTWHWPEKVDEKPDEKVKK